MGRQICFFHCESDINDFLEMISKCDGSLRIDGRIYAPLDSEKTILETMKSLPQKIIIIPKENIANAHFCTEFTGAVEFSNCYHPHSALDTLSYGRLYIAPDRETGEYDLSARLLFQRLKTSIQKRYIFCPKSAFYVSDNFLNKYREKELFASQSCSAVNHILLE